MCQVYPAGSSVTSASAAAGAVAARAGLNGAAADDSPVRVKAAFHRSSRGAHIAILTVLKKRTQATVTTMKSIRNMSNTFNSRMVRPQAWECRRPVELREHRSSARAGLKRRRPGNRCGPARRDSSWGDRVPCITAKVQLATVPTVPSAGLARRWRGGSLNIYLFHQLECPCGHLTKYQMPK